MMRREWTKDLGVKEAPSFKDFYNMIYKDFKPAQGWKDTHFEFECRGDDSGSDSDRKGRKGRGRKGGRMMDMEGDKIMMEMGGTKVMIVMGATKVAATAAAAATAAMTLY